MHKAILAVVAVALIVSVAHAADSTVTMPIRQFIDGFNKGDVKSAYAAYASSGDIVVEDEFAPHLWVGPHAAQDWAADYDKHSQANGVTDSSVIYSTPTRIEIDGDKAYVVIPTVYNYKDHGQATTEQGQMTFVLNKEKGVWKIRAWTWTGTKPHPAK